MKDKRLTLKEQSATTYEKWAVRMIYHTFCLPWEEVRQMRVGHIIGENQILITDINRTLLTRSNENFTTNGRILLALATILEKQDSEYPTYQMIAKYVTEMMAQSDEIVENTKEISQQIMDLNAFIESINNEKESL